MGRGGLWFVALSLGACDFDASALGGELTADVSSSSGSAGVTGTSTGEGEPGHSSGTADAMPAFRRRVVFTEAVRSFAQSDVVLLVRLDPERIDYAHTRPQGAGLQFYDATGVNRLPHEIDEWHPGGTSFVWVRVPLIDTSDAGASIWMHYGLGLDDVEDAQAVWSDRYVGVWHLKTGCTPSQTLQPDATDFAHDGTCEGAEQDGSVASVVGTGLRFDGIDDHITMSRTPALLPEAGITVEYWVRLDEHPTDRLRAAVELEGSYASYVLRTGTVGDPGLPRFNVRLASMLRGVSAQAPFELGSWVYVVNTFDAEAGRLRFYVDGSTVGFQNFPEPAGLAGEDGRLVLGAGVPGTLDEVRLSRGARTDAYAAVQHLSMTNKAIVVEAPEPLD